MKFAILIFSILMVNHAKAWSDPTEGKPFFPWVWEDNLKPTVKKSVDKTGLIIMGSGVASTLVVHEFDKKIYNYNEENPILFSDKTEETLGSLGTGVFGLGIALTQLAFDEDNGVKHLTTLFFTNISHYGITRIAQRHRPGNRESFLDHPSSLPSGHSTAAFATAGALAYSYGWKAGVPAYAVASSIALSRVRGSRHWASDIVAGAFLGTFWARASYTAHKEEVKTSMWVPSPVLDGMMVSWIKEF